MRRLGSGGNPTSSGTARTAALIGTVRSWWIRGIDGRIDQGDSFLNDRFPDLKADYILANPSFNMKIWGGEHLRDDKRWKSCAAPTGNTNFSGVPE